jgi:hypothetical protein
MTYYTKRVIGRATTESVRNLLRRLHGEPSKLGLTQCKAPPAIRWLAARTHSGVWERPPAREAVMTRPSVAASYLWKWYDYWGQVTPRGLQERGHDWNSG